MDSLLNNLGTVAIVLIVVLIVIAVVLVVALVRKHRRVHQPDTPVPTKVAYWLSLAYTALPVDVLPDPIYFDDIVVLTSGLLFVSTSLRRKGNRQVEGES
ncbi:YkvA family protein [Actinokineospora globicatena]|uniref:DUF1232 domain-containing protein n=1 Tax=Actinokineospora globicatena TaxID=103729 RepID=A0A9W6QUE6_9PSEU|nr:YkvA family protein [Actinokineospora globicatena]GLW95005.1 hypothetical protein Aglo03_58210 [Actinokineospora globicatena]